MNEDNIYFSFVKYGFYVFFLKVLEVIFIDKIEENLVNKVVNYIGKIGFNILGLREEFVEEIKFYKLLLEIVFLLVVIGFKKMEIMREV